MGRQNKLIYDNAMFNTANCTTIEWEMAADEIVEGRPIENNSQKHNKPKAVVSGTQTKCKVSLKSVSST